MAGEGRRGAWEAMDRRGWALALLVCLPALVPTVLPGWFEGHDDLHIYRLIEYDAALRDGQIPPRWFPDISAGLGSPHPLYYAPLFYYAAGLLHLAGCGVILSLKGAIVLVMALAALGMYRYTRLFFSIPASVVAAAAYTYAPYHLLDLYVRKAFSELTVFAVLPFLLEAFHQLRFRRDRLALIAAAFWLGALFISHTITAMLAPPLLAAYALMLSRLPDPSPTGPRGSSRKWTFSWLPRAASASGLGFALAAFFLVPAFLERDAINLKMYTEAYVDYHKHFVYASQLAWSPWGFGMSLAGTRDGMSFRLGLAHIAAMALAAVGLSRLRQRAARSQAAFHLGLAAAGIFLMLPISLPVWDAIASFRFVQFPWRFLMLTTLASGLLAGAAFVAWGPSGAGQGGRSSSRSWMAALAICVLMAAGAAAGGTMGVNLRVPADRVSFEEKPYNNMIDRGAEAPPESMDRDFVRRHTLHWLDHLPPGVSYLGLTLADADRPRAEVLSGDARIEDLRSGTWWTRFRVVGAGSARIRVNAYRFPGWVVRVNGAEAELLPAPARSRPVLFFDVPAGSHEVEALFLRTAPRALGGALTLAGLGALAALALWPRSRRT